MSSSSTPALAFVPLAQPDISSAISVLEDSLSDPSIPNPLAPPALTIKDKAADLGLKDIVDKASWIEAKKIIDAWLCCPPYCPIPDSKALITTMANAVHGGKRSSTTMSNLLSPTCLLKSLVLMERVSRLSNIYISISIHLAPLTHLATFLISLT
jgi:hypothetical protein